MMADIEHQVASLTAKCAMGALSLRERFRLMWWVLTGKIVTFSGECLICVRVEPPK